MKRLLALLLVAIAGLTFVALDTHEANAQDEIYVDIRAAATATDIVNGRVVSTQSVEIDGQAFRVSEVEISAAVKGALSGTILVETPGGERSDGTIVYVSHTPRLEAGAHVQLALSPRDDVTGSFLSAAMGGASDVYSVTNGSEGAFGLLTNGLGRAAAVGDYTLTGASWPDFTPPVGFYVNPANSGVSLNDTLDGVRRAFQIWEDDALSDVDFVYRGQSSKTGLDLNDDENTVSWVTTSSGWLAQASWIATGDGDIIGFDVRVNRSYQWANGAVGGRYDIATVVAHEVGHGIGFGHAPASSELMYFQIQSGRTKGLGAGDTSGAAFLYPTSDPICNGELATVELGEGDKPTAGRDVIVGTFGDDVIDGLGGDDVICGNGGDDQISGGGGNDFIDGGTGNDRLFGGPGVDEIRGGFGNDVIHGNLGPDVLYGDGGNDKIFGYADNDTIYGGDGIDFLHGNRGNDRIFGGSGADRIWGYAGDDGLEGQDGDDLIVGNYGDDRLVGGNGSDIIKGVGGDDTLSGGPSNDELIGNDGNDALDGGPGNDSLDGGVDSDTCIGGDGLDTTRRCESVA